MKTAKVIALWFIEDIALWFVEFLLRCLLWLRARLAPLYEAQGDDERT